MPKRRYWPAQLLPKRQYWPVQLLPKRLYWPVQLLSKRQYWSVQKDDVDCQIYYTVLPNVKWSYGQEKKFQHIGTILPKVTTFEGIDIAKHTKLVRNNIAKAYYICKKYHCQTYQIGQEQYCQSLPYL